MLEVELVPLGEPYVPVVPVVPVVVVDVVPVVLLIVLVDDVIDVSVDAVDDDDVEPVASVPVWMLVLLSFVQANVNNVSAAANRIARDFFMFPLLKKNALPKQGVRWAL